MDPSTIIEAVFAGAVEAHREFASTGRQAVEAAARRMARAIAEGRKVLIFGNGGSAADAQHFAAELVCRYVTTRQAMPALALTTDTSILTAVGNDFGFERVFARQIEAIGASGDVAFGISTSGRSPNVVAAFAEARAKGMTLVALTGGDGGALGAAADLHINVPSSATPRVQEVHRTILHALCELIEHLAGTSAHA